VPTTWLCTAQSSTARLFEAVAVAPDAGAGRSEQGGEGTTRGGPWCSAALQLRAAGAPVHAPGMVIISTTAVLVSWGVKGVGGQGEWSWKVTCRELASQALRGRGRERDQEAGPPEARQGAVWLLCHDTQRRRAAGAGARGGAAREGGERAAHWAPKGCMCAVGFARGLRHAYHPCGVACTRSVCGACVSACV
jgi:hypothetical protein